MFNMFVQESLSEFLSKPDQPKLFAVYFEIHPHYVTSTWVTEMTAELDSPFVIFHINLNGVAVAADKAGHSRRPRRSQGVPRPDTICNLPSKFWLCHR